MNEKIIRFLQQQTCATICLLDQLGSPYCFNCFYAFNYEQGLLYFKSSADSYHSRLMKTNTQIAGTILPDKLNTLLIKGVQFNGQVLEAQDPLTAKATLLYHKKHPLALTITGEVHTIHINRVKMTDGTKSLRMKITWSRNEKI